MWVDKSENLSWQVADVQSWKFIIVPTFEESKEYICSGGFFYPDQFSKMFPLGDRTMDHRVLKRVALATILSVKSCNIQQFTRGKLSRTLKLFQI